MIKKIITWVLDLFYPIFQKLLPYELYCYLAVGAVNTALNIALFAVLLEFVLPASGVSIYGLLFKSYTICLLLAFVITVPTGYWLAKNFAFRQTAQTGQDAKMLGKYSLVVLQGLASDYLILKLLIELAGINPTLAKVSSTVIVLIGNYLLQKYFTFRTKAG